MCPETPMFSRAKPKEETFELAHERLAGMNLRRLPTNSCTVSQGRSVHAS